MSQITAATVAIENDRIAALIDDIDGPTMPEEMKKALDEGTALIYATTYQVNGHTVLQSAKILFVAPHGIKTIVDTEDGTITSAASAQLTKPSVDEQDRLVIRRREPISQVEYAVSKYLGLGK